MEGAIMKRKYYPPEKPNIGALHGKVGMSIIETIRNTPKPDRKELEKQCAEIEARVLAAKSNGTF